MGPLAAAAPALIGVGGTIGAGLLGRPRASSEERQAFGALRDTAGQLGQQSRSLFDIGRPALRQAAGFFGPLASGNRTAIEGTLAPGRAAITEAGIGARRGAEASLPRGGARTLALGNINRGTAAQQGLLVPRVRTGAATSLSNLGINAAAAAVGGTARAGSLLGQLAGLEQRGGLVRTEQATQVGTDLGAFLFRVLQGSGGSGGNGGSKENGFATPAGAG